MSSHPTAWTLTLDGIPATKGRARHDTRSGGRGHTHTPDRTSTYEQRIAGAAIEAGVVFDDARAFAVHVEAWVPDRRPRDLDNMIKIALDGLQRAGRRALPGDDCFRVPRVSASLGGVAKGAPRMVITIETVDQP